MPIFDTQAIQRIQTWSHSLQKEISIQLALPKHAETIHFSSMADQLCDIIPVMKITRTEKDQALPGFGLKDNIDFCALPLEKELDPFLESLSYISGSPYDMDDKIKTLLDRIDIPVHLKLYIALACPHCPSMVRTVIPLALHCSHIHLQIIDGSLFTEQAQKDNILSAPTLILDDDFRWTQNIDQQEIIRMITDRDPSQLSAQTLKTILEQGDAQWITDQMIEKGVIFDGFLKLILHPTWSVRLGAMVVVEDLSEKDPELAASLCPILIKLFDTQETTVQGDILYALGEAGTKDTAQWIKKTLASLTHQDLIDAARDALDTLESNT